MLFNTGHRTSEVATDNGYADWMLARLDAMAVAIPEERGKFHSRLCIRAQHHASCVRAFSEPDDVLAMLAEAGFALDRLFEIGVKLSNAGHSSALRRTKRKFIALARPEVGC